MTKNLLGIDYGRKKVGISIASSSLAEPLQVVRYKSISDLLLEILRIIEKYKIDEIVVGLSEGEMAAEAKEFGKSLNAKFGLPVEFSDETLTTSDAQSLSIKAGKSRKTRSEMEDAYAAALMLQGFIDNRH